MVFHTHLEMIMAIPLYVRHCCPETWYEIRINEFKSSQDLHFCKYIEWGKISLYLRSLTTMIRMVPPVLPRGFVAFYEKKIKFCYNVAGSSLFQKRSQDVRKTRVPLSLLCKIKIFRSPKNHPKNHWYRQRNAIVFISWKLEKNFQ